MKIKKFTKKVIKGDFPNKYPSDENILDIINHAIIHLNEVFDPSVEALEQRFDNFGIWLGGVQNPNLSIYGFSMLTDLKKILDVKLTDKVKARRKVLVKDLKSLGYKKRDILKFEPVKSIEELTIYNWPKRAKPNLQDTLDALRASTEGTIDDPRVLAQSLLSEISTAKEITDLSKIGEIFDHMIDIINKCDLVILKVSYTDRVFALLEDLPLEQQVYCSRILIQKLDIEKGDLNERLQPLVRKVGKLIYPTS